MCFIENSNTQVTKESFSITVRDGSITCSYKKTPFSFISKQAPCHYIHCTLTGKG